MASKQMQVAKCSTSAVIDSLKKMIKKGNFDKPYTNCFNQAFELIGATEDWKSRFTKLS